MVARAMPMRVRLICMLPRLTMGTIESASLSHDDPFHLGSTYQAGFACPSVDPKMVLVIAAAVNPVDAGSIAADAFLERIADGRMKRSSSFAVDFIRGGQWMKFC